MCRAAAPPRMGEWPRLQEAAGAAGRGGAAVGVRLGSGEHRGGCTAAAGGMGALALVFERALYACPGWIPSLHVSLRFLTRKAMPSTREVGVGQLFRGCQTPRVGCCDRLLRGGSFLLDDGGEKLILPLVSCADLKIFTFACL